MRPMLLQMIFYPSGVERRFLLGKHQCQILLLFHGDFNAPHFAHDTKDSTVSYSTSPQPSSKNQFEHREDNRNNDTYNRSHSSHFYRLSPSAQNQSFFRSPLILHLDIFPSNADSAFLQFLHLTISASLS